MAEPGVTVLVPTHNRAEVLRLALQSILAQSRQDFEALVVGDGCTDHSAQVVRSFQDPRLRWFDFPKGPGFGYAHRAEALRTARGELIGYLAHDDLWFPDHLERLGALFAEPRVEWAYSRPLMVTARGEIRLATFDLAWPEVLAEFIGQKANQIPIANVVHRRRCLEQYGSWRDGLAAGGDLELWARMLTGGGLSNWQYLPVPTALHFVADWRRVAHDSDPLYAAGRDLIEAESPWAPALRLTITPGQAEQEAAWQRLQDNSADWPSEVRRAVELSLDYRVYRLEAINRDLAELMPLRDSFGVSLVRRLRDWRFRWAPPGTSRGQTVDGLMAWLRKLGRSV